MSDMYGYGLTENEKGKHLHDYNHALFRNMMFFMDIVWEINVLTGTVFIFQNKNEPDRSGKEFPYQQAYDDYMEKRICEEEKPIFERYLSPENVRKLTREVFFDIRLKPLRDSQELHRVVLTPAFDSEGKLYCVYLGARNLQAEVSRKLAEYRIREQLMDALVSNTYFHFDFSLTGDGMIHEDFRTLTGIPLVRNITEMELPVPFETFVQKWFEKADPQFDREQGREIFSLDYLKQSYMRNERLIDMEVNQTAFWGDRTADSLQIVIVLMEDVADGHVHANVIWRDIGIFHRQAIENNKLLNRTISQEQQFRLAALSGALYVYNINLTRNLIEEEFYEITEGRQYPVLQSVGLTAPCSFDEFVKRWSEQKVPESSRGEFLRVYNREYMLDAYARGERKLETEFETVSLRKGPGNRIVLRNTALLVEDKENGDILVVMNSKDVTKQKREEKRQQEALREAYEAANRASAAKTEFLTRISHDIRTPMNAIIGMTAIAEKQQENQGRVKECLRKINLSSKYLLSLVDEMLDMSMIETGKIKLQEEEIDLAELFDNLGIILEMHMKEKDHKFSARIAHIEHEKVVGDRRRINQIIMNLVDNAAKYTMENGQISMTLEEKPTNKQNIGCYEITVEDNGIGMDPEFIRHLFEPFVRAKDRRVEKIPGSGLGLAITNNIVRMMNGTIDVKSDSGQGTRVTVKIFLKLAEDESDVFSKLEGTAVLVVDGDGVSSREMSDLLEDLGLKSECATTAREALERTAKRHLENDDYCVIILDRNTMGGSTVVDVAREIHEITGDATAIIISADSDCSDIEKKAGAAGVTSFITKPYSRAGLVHMFRIITGKETEGEDKSPIQSLTEKNFSGNRALMVEDNESNADIIREILEMVGLEIEHAWNGKEAVEMIASAEDWYYNIIFMDIQMPVMDGYEAARAIRQLDRQYAREVPILAMSANAFAEDVQASLEAGMNEHISKPIDFKKLEESLCRWLPERA